MRDFSVCHKGNSSRPPRDRNLGAATERQLIRTGRVDGNSSDVQLEIFRRWILSEEVLGEKQKFKYEDGLIDIKNILKRFNDETLKKRIVEIIKEVIQDDVVKGIRTQII